MQSRHESINQSINLFMSIRGMGLPRSSKPEPNQGLKHQTIPRFFARLIFFSSSESQQAPPSIISL